MKLTLQMKQLKIQIINKINNYKNLNKMKKLTFLVVMLAFFANVSMAQNKERGNPLTHEYQQTAPKTQQTT